MSKPKVLVQLDTDAQASVFDSVVAIDAGVEHLLRHQAVTPDLVRGLVYGAIFTRSVADLRQTAIFIGGSDVAAGEAILQEVCQTFFGPMRVSVMMDSGGANTTAAAAVLAAGKQVELKGAEALVLAATGPVGQRAARLLAGSGCRVRVASRSIERAGAVCETIRALHPSSQLTAYSAAEPDELAAALEGAQIVVSAGPPGVVLVPAEILRQAASLRVAIDLNAVPPLGIAGIEAQDRGMIRAQTACYGALGVGGVKMKIHKAAVSRLFESNDQVLDAEQILDLARQLGA